MTLNSLPHTVRALVSDIVDGKPQSFIQTIKHDAFQKIYAEGDTLVRVTWSSLNYKDAMALCGNRSRILRNMPIVPGIDLAGEVLHTTHPDLKPGMPVLATGWGLGEKLSGGYTTHARLPGQFLIPIPDGLDARSAMQIGTAGFTAMLAIRAIRNHINPPKGSSIAVTGAGGGVGSQAIAILNAYGYAVTAFTSKVDDKSYFRKLGASHVESIHELEGVNKPLDSTRWSAGIDTVGGEILANLLSGLETRGAIAACGLASSPKLVTTVLPFILRGVALLGIDSVYCPADVRKLVWSDLAAVRDVLSLDQLCTEAGLEELPALAEDLLANRRHGRILVRTS